MKLLNFLIFAVNCLVPGLIAAALSNDDVLQRRFAESTLPLLQTYCLDCHGKERQEAKLDLSDFKSLSDVAGAHQTWEIVLERLQAKEMPPEDAKRQLSAEQRQALIQWIRNVRQHEALRNAGDPGSVLARRLSNSEYNYTIRDLTGVNIRPTQTFPVDPANEAGFDNSGESLAMSPALLNKYLGAARQVVEHLVLKPEGFDFAPHPVVTNTDRDKYCVNRIVEFYKRQPTDLADYFFSAWQFKQRAAIGKPDATLADFAAASRVSPKYLVKVWSALTEEETVGPLAKLQAMWRDLPDDTQQASDVQAGCEQMRDFVVNTRSKLKPKFRNLYIEGSHKGSQPFVLWKNRQYAAHRRTFDREAIQKIEAIPAEASKRIQLERAYARFCSVFPDRFYVSERGRDYLDKPREQQEKGRLLSAGFHSMMGYFRDDGPLYDLVLDEAQQRKLDRLWQELDFIASAPQRQYSGFLWFERTDSRYMRDPEFDFARAEDKAAQSEKMIKRLAKVYLAKARNNGGGEVEIEAIEDYFHNIDAQIRWVEKARLAAKPSHMKALLEFAQRAYRRKLTNTEQQELLLFYRSLRRQDGLSHEEAIQDTIVSVLMSPWFCYRMDLAAKSERVQPLADYELASRLSYFIWSSMPDEQLLARAAAGEIHHPEVLRAETNRMLQDPRVRGLAIEFGGNWLDYRRFEQHNSVDRGRFPSFTDELRQAMFEEPNRFFVDVIQNNRSVLEFLYGDHTFVNRVLAQHYGMGELYDGLPRPSNPVRTAWEGHPTETSHWVRIDGASKFGRGGLLPMSVFLTKNAPGLRTSPVKRGYWVVRRLLGERIPPPPPNVPELPNDESKLGDLTLREVLARHREHKSCAGCHQRFDSIGLAFEGFGPVGERRTKDLGGRPVETRASFPGGDEGSGLDGLRTYLREYRQDEFLDNLCRKLLSYGLSRTLLISDEPLVQEMKKNTLAANGYRFGTLVECIVTSEQFLNKRGRNKPAKNLSENRRGLAHFAESSEQNVPVPLSSGGFRIGSKVTSVTSACPSHRCGSLNSRRKATGVRRRPFRCQRCAARVWRWHDHGSNHCPFGDSRQRPMNLQRLSPSDSPRCSWLAEFIRIIGGPRGTARRWN